MKKSLIALAVLATSGAAFAQSNASLSGLVGFGYQSVDAGAAGASRGLLNTDASIFVNASEDLGGGMKASVSIALDSADPAFGNALLRRDTSLSLSSGLGTVSFLSTRSGNLLTKGMVAPAVMNDGLYDTSGIIDRLPIDAIVYASPAYGSWSGYLQYVEAGNAGSTTPTVGITVLGVSYSKDALEFGAAFKNHSFPANTNAIRSSRIEAFATYDFGVAKVGVGYDGAIVGTSGPVVPTLAGIAGGAADTTENSVTSSAAYAFGVAMPVGAFTVGFNWAKRDINTVSEFAVQYDLSKRTNINASFGKQSFDADYTPGTTTGISGNQYRVGVYHSF